MICAPFHIPMTRKPSTQTITQAMTTRPKMSAMVSAMEPMSSKVHPWV